MGRKKCLHFAFRCLVLSGLLVLCPGGEPSWGEDQGFARTETGLEADPLHDGTNPGAWLAALFRDHLSAVDGDRCPSYPTCSSFSVSAFKKHGFFIGWILTVDRLIHEGREETAVSPVVYQEGRPRIFDPVENNDFWWYRRVPEGHR